jgi:hypothetical protein
VGIDHSDGLVVTHPDHCFHLTVIGPLAPTGVEDCIDRVEHFVKEMFASIMSLLVILLFTHDFAWKKSNQYEIFRKILRDMH